MVVFNCGVVVMVDCFNCWVVLDFECGVQVVVVEVVCNLSCVGVEFLVVIDNFNFLLLEIFKGFWQLVMVCCGIFDVCCVFNIFVIGGNVLFYNEIKQDDGMM